MDLLLIEDEDGIRRAMAVHLRRDGHRVEVASTLTEARQMLSQQTFDGIVSDLKLPDGSSLDVLESAALPSIVMSGYAVFEDAVRAIRVGCVDFLTKPVPKDVLLHAVRRLQPRQEAVMVLACPQSPSVTTWYDCVSGDKHELHAATQHWTSPQEVADNWLPPETNDSRVRQIDAELCQLLPAAQLIRNCRQGRWRWFLPHPEPLPEAQAERKAVIVALADRWQETGAGIVVEVAA